MSDEQKGQRLIDAFLEAIRLRRLDQCQKILQELETFSRQQPDLKPWYEYLKGLFAFETHRWAEAEQILSELLWAEPEPILRGRTLYTLGRSFDAQGRWDEALAAFEKTLSVATKLGQISEQVRAWKHMAISLHKGFTHGDFGSAVLTKAITYCQSALNVLGSVEDSTSNEIAWLTGTVWNVLGLVYVSLAQWNEAIDCYQQDLAICRTLDDRYGMGLTYGNLGEVYQKLGNWPEALTAYQQALAIIREFDDRYEEIEVLTNVAFLYQEMSNHDLALDYYSQTINVIEDLRADTSSETAQAGFFATVIDTYANTVLLCLKAGRKALAFDYVERSRSRTFLDILIARSPNLSQTVETATLTLAEVQAALPHDTLLLEYFTTGLVEAADERAAQQAERHRFPPAKMLLFAVTRDTFQLYPIDLSPNDLYPRHLDNIVERHFLDAQIRRTLYDRLIAPVEKLLWNKHRIYLAPHGPLHYIPFQALVAPDGETLLREVGPPLVYTPSATLLFRPKPEHAHSPLASCLTIGYNSEGDSQLYFAEDEARSVARLTQGQTLVGPMPKKATLFAQAADYRLLHLACHGEFDPESPLASFLYLAPDETLTALEVMEQLRLRCDLVTLSACESGLSRVRRGDELIGLMRAFMYAGASAMVSTLWRVNDHPTRILMEKFYRQIQAGVNMAEALKQAQLYVKNLTYQEALDILVSLDDQPDELSDPGPSSTEAPFGLPRTGLTLQQATTYLRGVASRGRAEATNILPDEVNDGPIFAEPYFWAAFILIGDDGAERLGESVEHSP